MQNYLWYEAGRPSKERRQKYLRISNNIIIFLKRNENRFAGEFIWELINYIYY